MKKAIHIGAGNIGRGFLGQLYFESGLETVFIDVNQAVIDAINTRKRYDITIAQDPEYIVPVENIRAINGSETDAAAAEIRDAVLMSVSVGVRFLASVAPLIRKGIEQRSEAQPESTLNIIVCENMLGAAEMLKEEIGKGISENARPYLEEKTGFLGSVIARQVPLVPEEKFSDNPLYISVEAYKVLPVDRLAIKGEIPEIVGMLPVDNIDGWEERKLFVHNLHHGVCAYITGQRYTYIWEALEDPEIFEVTKGAMQESGRTLIKKHGFDPQEMEDFINDLLTRNKNRALGDTIFRAARDPIRKLGRHDRLTGAGCNCLEQGIRPDNIVKGLAAGIRYSHPDDPASLKVSALFREKGPEAVLEEICGLEPNHPLFQLVTKQARRL